MGKEPALTTWAQILEPRNQWGAAVSVTSVPLHWDEKQRAENHPEAYGTASLGDSQVVESRETLPQNLMEGKKQLLKAVLWPAHTCHGMQTPTHTPILIMSINNIFTHIIIWCVVTHNYVIFPFKNTKSVLFLLMHWAPFPQRIYDQKNYLPFLLWSASPKKQGTCNVLAH